MKKFSQLVVFLLLVTVTAAAKGKGKAKGEKKVVPTLVDLSTGKSSITVNRGHSVQIVCLGSNESDDTVRTTWLINNTVIVDELPNIEISRMGLKINKVKSKDAGVYGCHATFEHNEDVNIRRNITIAVKQRKTEEDDFDEEEEEKMREAAISCSHNMPSDTNQHYLCFDLDDVNRRMSPYFVKAAGTSVTLNCNVKGNPLPHVTWYKDEKPFHASGHHHRIFNNTLTIKEVVVNDYATYTCEATNLLGSIQYEIKLAVTHRTPEKPKVTKVQNTTVLEGEDFRFSCELDAEDETDESPPIPAEYLELEPTIVKFERRKNDQNESAKVSHAKPIFTEAPKNLTVMKSGNALLWVDILSDAEYIVQWKKHSSEHPERHVMVQSRTNNQTILNDPNVLYLENVTLDDAGWYSCEVTNSIGRSDVVAYLDVVTEVRTNAVTTGVNHDEYTLFFVAVPVALIFVFIIALSVWYLQNKHHLKKLKIKMQEHGVKGWTKVVVVDRVPARDSEDGAILIPEVNIKSVATNRNNEQEYELPADERWEFPRDRLIIGKHLGEGAFGEVSQATANGILERGISTTVAVKTLKNTHSDADMIDLISEMETMKELGKHPNIINLLGCCTARGELLVVMEFAEHGSLLEFLRTNRHNYCYEKPNPPQNNILIEINTNDVNAPPVQPHLTFRDLMSYAFQVARGMDYLAQRKYVHRDLAARNVLIAANHVAKICDFGMTRSTFANDYYRKKSDGRVPIKWMAPETLIHRVYTTQSDVWSYGILLWEIVTLGGSPYPTMPDMNYLLEFVRSGKRMLQPPNCPTELYILMRDCWMDSPTARPTFGQLVDDIGRILYIASETEYFELEGTNPSEEEIITPPSSPENSSSGMIMFDPEFVKSFS